MQKLEARRTSDKNQHHGFIDYNSYYPPIFPLSSSISPTDSSITEQDATESRLDAARLILENQQLYNRYAMCFSQLQDALKQIDLLRESYAAVRAANADLVSRLRMQNCLSEDFSRLSLEMAANTPIGGSPTSVIEGRDRFGPIQRSEKERVTLPKSISVRSSGYMPPQRGGGSGDPSRGHRVNSVKTPTGLGGGSQRVCVPGAAGENKSSLEFEVYNQGMFKTELCNKWQETGTCPYGNNCQFAHGITELRPVIRHPRYKTEVCRMVLSGDSCPYGHRCHFRHSLTPEEKMLGPLHFNELNGYNQVIN